MDTRSRSWSAALLLAAALFSAEVYYERPVQAGAQVNVDINFFYGALAPYGSWVDHRLYGRVWYPSGVPGGWRPYTDGHWDYTYEYGWTWVSDWAWGWAPFHYGRWIWDDWYGWVWVPGSVWAPAWVVWRYGGGYAAWAPMPPNLMWNPGYGLSTYYFDYDRDLPWNCWVGVPERHFGDRHINRYLIDPRYNDRYLQGARNFVNPGMENNAVFNHGVPIKHIEKVSDNRVHPLHVHEVERPEERGHDKRSNGLKVYRPHFRAPGEDELRREQALAEQTSRQNEARHRGADQVRSAARQQRLPIPGRLRQQDYPGVSRRPEQRGERTPSDRGPQAPAAYDNRRPNDFIVPQEPAQELAPGQSGQRNPFYDERRNLEVWQRQRREQQEQRRQFEWRQTQQQEMRPGQDMQDVRLRQEERGLQQRREPQNQQQNDALFRQQLEMQQRQAEQAQRMREEAAVQQQRQTQQEQLRRQEQMNLQRRQTEQAEQSRREQMRRQQQDMEMQRNRMEQVERANREALRQQQMLEQQERTRYEQLQQQENMRRQQEMQMQRQQEMQMQRQQDMYRQQAEMQRQQSDQMRQQQAQQRSVQQRQQPLPPGGRRWPGAE